MKQTAGEFYKNLKGRRVAFIGAGVSHRECIEMFAQKGAIVTLCDKKPDLAAFGEYGEVNKAWTADDVKGFTKILGNQIKIYHNVQKRNEK